MSRWQIARRSRIGSEIAFSSVFISTRTTSRSPLGWRLITPRIKSPQPPRRLRGCLFYGDHFPSRRILKVKGSQDSFKKRWSPAHGLSIEAHRSEERRVGKEGRSG